MRKGRVLGWAAVAAAAGAAAVFLPPPEPPSPPVVVQSAKPEVPPSDSRLTLPSREGLGRPSRDPFASHTPPPRPAPAPKQAATPPVAVPAAPVAPPVPYRVAGQVVHDGPAQVVLARDDRVYLVRQGDLLDGGYRVESITPEGVTLVYTPLEHSHQLAAVSSLATPTVAPPAPPQMPHVAQAKPVQLRWEGPARVQAGSEFEVALKMTSQQAVRGSPLQLSYDAKLLEPVSVRAGGFFVDGSFTYRVNPGGSIFVGAFGKGEIPADAEFLVVKFKSIRAGAVAELKLSSLVLQGMAGSTLAHEPPAAFRTSITQ
jgi:hypothetical protein